MTESAPLKLVALDEEDLAVISAHVQDAVLKVADLRFLPAERRFVVAMNRFTWERAGERKSYERRRAALAFDRVRSVRSQKIMRQAADTVLNLLAVEYVPTDAPAGTVDLVFAGGATVRLEVECVEARLSDLGPAWATTARPSHETAGSTGG